MTTLYCARQVLPISSPSIEDGGIAVERDLIVDIGKRHKLIDRFPDSHVNQFQDAVILPGLVNAHSHLELTAMRGFLENEEGDFFAWLRKLTFARLERMTADDRYVSATWGACEAVRAGITCVADASDEAYESMKALRDVGLRGTVFQESFGPDPNLAAANFEKLKVKVEPLSVLQTALVKPGVSPHAPYTVCASQLKLIAEFAGASNLPVMMHVAESAAEEMLLREGRGPFAEALKSRGIEWQMTGMSPVEYLERHGVLQTKPLLAHCVRTDQKDIQIIKETGASIAHCPKSNAKLGHGRAPFSAFLSHGIPVGIGSDSVASNNTCDILEEARFATLISRQQLFSHEERWLSSNDALHAATLGGAKALGLEGQIGELKKHFQADFSVVALDDVHQLPSYDPADTLIFCSSGRNVILTVIAGREVYREGQVTSVDEDRLRARILEIGKKLAA